ncbi:putative pumilio homolog 7, chloroplastic [Bidens hawaiensis]|uniref:putative pumilio homolog 7, chloroplastic n=1 Tax=Bidens hawaiensis TaxID=980011 RepID=UPI004049BB48
MDDNFTKPFSTNPIFSSYGFSRLQISENLCHPQSNYNTNMPNIRYPMSYDSQIPGLYHAKQYGMLKTSDDSLIIGGFRGQNKKCGHSRFAGACENGKFSVGNKCFSTPVRCKTLGDVKGFIYMFAKEQNRCRFIQSVFDEENPKHVEMVFNETIGHVNELMVNPFGNYLIQKLLEVCNEEQRMCVLMEVTRKPRELVRISLNTHGTRAVQKLIETVKMRKQIKMIVAALEPGFLALIKDLNGNHVIQRCLQCLSNEDNKFIFEAAAKFCADIATHQQGCCVLQRYTNHSTGKHQERLILEISSNRLLLAQDAFGNYVVQSILELQSPSAISMLTSQFEGNYFHLATQKFSSHVVEKCLLVLDDHLRSRIIRELLASARFEHLLQDPHANYVVQTALRVAEDSLHNLLVKAIESHKAISRNSPYSKRIFSHKLLKK